MSRQLPPTITADATPDWLPAGWIVHSTVLKRGRQTKTYTQLRTGKKLYTKDRVLEYIKMEKIREKKASVIERKKANMYVNTSKESALLVYENTIESEASSSEEDEIECNQISYVIDEDEEDISESEYFADKGSPQEDVEILSYITSTSLRSQPERIHKTESRAKTQCVFEDEEDMSSDSDNIIPEAEISKGEARVVANLVEAFEEKNLHDVVVECDGEAREIQGLTGSFTIEINLDCEPASDSLVEKDLNKSVVEGIGTRNIEIIDLESDMVHTSVSSKVGEVTQEPVDKSEESLKAQAAQEETPDDMRTLVFFNNSNTRSSAEDLSNNTELGLNPQENNISGSKKRKKNIKKKDIEVETKKLQKNKTQPSIRRRKKGSLSVVMGKKTDDWPEPCPNFPFEPLTSSSRIEDDSVIRMYLEQQFAAAGSTDSNLPLPDFGLPSFSNIKISLHEEPESKRKKSPGPLCVQVASSSLPSCSSIIGTTTMQQTVVEN